MNLLSLSLLPLPFGYFSLLFYCFGNLQVVLTSLDQTQSICALCYIYICRQGGFWPRSAQSLNGLAEESIQQQRSRFTAWPPRHTYAGFASPWPGLRGAQRAFCCPDGSRDCHKTPLALPIWAGSTPWQSRQLE